MESHDTDPHVMVSVSTPLPDKNGPRQVTLAKQRKTPLSRSNSVRSKGIGLNLAVSPVNSSPNPGNNATFSTTSNPTNFQQLQQVPEDLHTRSSSTSMSSHIDKEGPMTIEDVKNMDMESQLRVLASKEMNMVELKDTINNLTHKLNQQEREVKRLRQVIQRLLYSQLSQNQPESESELASLKDKGSWNLSKPLNWIQQLDSMIQSEFERSLIPQESTLQQSQQSQQNPHHLQQNQQYRKSRLSEDSTSSTSSIPSPLKTKSTNSDPVNLDQYLDEGGTRETKEDMIQTVSSSLWSFVSEIRNNVLTSMTDEELRDNERDDSQDNTIINETEFDRVLDLKNR